MKRKRNKALRKGAKQNLRNLDMDPQLRGRAKNF